jgi:uncharacterized RDD family membrane protein YckC
MAASGWLPPSAASRVPAVDGDTSLLRAPEAPVRVVGPAPPAAPVAGFWIRLGANVLDSLAIVLVGFVPPAIAIGLAAPGAVVALGAALLLFMYVLYAPIALTLNGGATWGKQACEQRVLIDDGRPIGFGRALLREVVVKWLFSVLVIPCWVSALMVGVREDKRGLHDLIVGTRVVRTTREGARP